MTFRTKIDITNRQVKQYPGTVVSLSGITSLGVSGNTGTTLNVFGNTQTDNLKVINGATIGYVLTCIDNEGKLEYRPSSGSMSGFSTDGYWTAGTGTNSGTAITTIANKLSGGDATGEYSVAEGFKTNLYLEAHGGGGL